MDGGEARPPCTKWGQRAARHQHRETRRPKEARMRTRPSRGVGGKEDIYPHPRQVKSCHVTTPLLPTCAAALQKILTKQSKHMYMYLLTKLSASQTATLHVYFKIHHIYKSITQFLKRGTWGRCWRAERAASTWHSARLRPVGAVQKGLFLNSCIQFNTATLKPEWFWRAGGLDGIHVGPRLK